MARKRLSNGKFARAYGPLPWRQAALDWARSVCQDPARASSLLALTTDLVFLSIEEQKKCDGFIIIAPDLLPGAEPERLLARFESALDRARLIAKEAGLRGLHVCSEGGFQAQGQALPHMTANPMYEMSWDFFERPDPRKTRRAERRRSAPEPEISQESAEDDPEWRLSIAALSQALREGGFTVLEAPWMTRDHAGALDQLGFRERARAFLEDHRLAHALRRELPNGLQAPARGL